MSGPKHLWSGDWRDESTGVSREQAAPQPKPQDPEPAVTPEPRVRGRRRAALARRLPGLRPALAVALVVGVVIAGGAYGLSTLFGSSQHPAPATLGGGGASVYPASQTSAVAKPVNWLGMEIVTVAPGVATVETVRQGSPGDLAGLEPGYIILEINGRAIHGAGDIAPAIHGLHAGDQVQMEISHGSSLYTTKATLAAPPSVYP